MELFQRMKQENLIPDEISYVLLIDALSEIGDLSLCQSWLSVMPENFLMNPWIQVGLIDLWVKFLLTSIDSHISKLNIFKRVKLVHQIKAKKYLT